MKTPIQIKKSIVVVGMFISIWATGYSQTVSELYYFNSSQTTIKTSYNANNQPIATQEYRIISFNGGNSVSGQNIKYKDGKMVDKTKSLFLSKENKLLISMGNDKNGNHAFLDYPMHSRSDHKIISTLEFEMEAVFAGKYLNVSCKIDNRTIVTSNEKITTPLGTWECIKMSYDMEIKKFGVPVKVFVIEWFSNKIGIVRTDIYKGGTLYEKKLLTGFKEIAG